MTEQPAFDKISSEHLLTLYEITRTMNSSLDFDEVLNTVIDSMMQVTRAQRGYLMIADESESHLQVLVARDISRADLEDEHGYSTMIVNQVVESRQSLLTNSAQLGEGDYQPSKSIIIHGLRAILCAPMIVQDRLIGVVYVDTSLRHTNFTEADRELLSAVAGQAGIAIENARLYRDAKKMGRMERELQMAREIQESLLPNHTPQILGYDVVTRWQSANEVAGDFYDVFALGDDKLVLVIADVSDKGAPAALFMTAARSMIRTNAYAGLSPQETMARTNDLILEDAGSGMFVTVYYSVFQADGYSSHVNGGHNPPMFYRHATREISYMPRGGRALGWFPDNPLQTINLRLEAGDMIIYYTDGLTEAENEAQDYFGEERLMQAIHEAGGQSAEAVMKNILARVDEFCAGVPPFDDLTLCVVRFDG